MAAAAATPMSSGDIAAQSSMSATGALLSVQQPADRAPSPSGWGDGGGDHSMVTGWGDGGGDVIPPAAPPAGRRRRGSISALPAAAQPPSPRLSSGRLASARPATERPGSERRPTTERTMSKRPSSAPRLPSRLPASHPLGGAGPAVKFGGLHKISPASHSHAS